MTYGDPLRSRTSTTSCMLSKVATCGRQLNKAGNSKVCPYSKGLTLIMKKCPTDSSADLFFTSNRYSSFLTFVKLNFVASNGWEMHVISSGARLFKCRSVFSCKHNTMFNVWFINWWVNKQWFINCWDYKISNETWTWSLMESREEVQSIIYLKVLLPSNFHLDSGKVPKKGKKEKVER